MSVSTVAEVVTSSDDSPDEYRAKLQDLSRRTGIRFVALDDVFTSIHLEGKSGDHLDITTDESTGVVRIENEGSRTVVHFDPTRSLS